jgi:type II secretory pathway pseudopilin PulG
MATTIIIQWQDQFGKWQRFQEKHNAADAFRTAQQRARSTGKRHRLLDAYGSLLDLIDP